MIEFAQSEHYNSPLEEDTLRILLSFLPREEYDKLLYGQVAHVRRYFRNPTRRMEKRFQLNRIRNGRVRLIEAAEGQKETTPLYSLASGG